MWHLAEKGPLWQWEVITGEELGAKRRSSDMYVTLSETVLQTTVLRRERRERELSVTEVT